MQLLPRAAFVAACLFLLLFLTNSITSYSQNGNAAAATRTSVQSGNWHTASTWQNGVVPSGNDNVVIASGTTVSLSADANGTGTITVEDGAIFDMRDNEASAGTLIALDGSEVRQAGSRSYPAITASSIQLALNSTYIYQGVNSSITDDVPHPTYGNLVISGTGSNGSVYTSLTVNGNLTIYLSNSRELRLRPNATYNFGSLNITRGVFVLNGSSGTTTINVAGDVLTSGTGTLRGTNSSGSTVLNVGGSLTNNGVFQQDDGDSTGNFTVNFNGNSTQHIAGTNPIAFEQLTVSNAVGVALDRDVSVDKTLTFSAGSINTDESTLLLGCAGTIANAGEGRFVEGYLAKEFCATGAFSFPVGTTTGYSPFSANVTSLAANPSRLTVAAFEGAGPGVEAANSVSRFWNVIEDGDLTANLSFNYRDADVTSPANEANYSLVKREGNSAPSVVCTGAGCINAASNIATATGVSTFSLWSIGFPVAPSSAEAIVTGRVLTAEGRAIPNAFLTAIGSDGRIRYALANPFGYFSFRGLAAGETYTVSIRSKSFEFASPVRVITLNDAESHLDFVASAR